MTWTERGGDREALQLRRLARALVGGEADVDDDVLVERVRQHELLVDSSAVNPSARYQFDDGIVVHGAIDVPAGSVARCSTSAAGAVDLDDGADERRRQRRRPR